MQGNDKKVSAMHPQIRSARREDAAAISELIVRAIKETNAKDYPAAFIEALPSNFSPERIEERLATRTTFVAFANDQIFGTASLDGKAVRSVFVLPEVQNNGVGSALMRHIEHIAKGSGVAVLWVPSSITAEGFYKRLGYNKVRDDFDGEERIVVMSKIL